MNIAVCADDHVIFCVFSLMYIHIIDSKHTTKAKMKLALGSSVLRVV